MPQSIGLASYFDVLTRTLRIVSDTQKGQTAPPPCQPSERNRQTAHRLRHRG